jgi:SsrA-binding protein
MKDNDKSIVPKPDKKELLITVNKKAFHDYEILSKYEAGIALTGTEVKALRLQKGSIKEAYAKVKDREVWLIASHIPAYKFGSYSNHEPVRDRKLLLHKSEIKKINTKLKEKGFTLIPLRIYFLGSNAKIELGLARGRKVYDKRETIRREEARKQLRQIKQSF